MNISKGLKMRIGPTFSFDLKPPQIPWNPSDFLNYEVRQYLGEIFHELTRQKECEIKEGYLLKDHVHMCICIPPNYAMSGTIGYLKGKSAIMIVDNLLGKLGTIVEKISGHMGITFQRLESMRRR